MDLPFLFRCPLTGGTAQGVTEADVLAEGPPTHYVGVICTACHRLHIVSPQTGQLLSAEADRHRKTTSQDLRI